MNLNEKLNALLCMLFSMNLGGHAKVWFHSLPARSVSSYQDMSDQFIAQFARAEIVWKPMDSLKSNFKKFGPAQTDQGPKPTLG